MDWRLIIKNEDDEKRSHSLNDEDLDNPAILDENVEDHYMDMVNDVINDNDVIEQLDNLSVLAQEVEDLAYELKHTIWNHDSNPLGEMFKGEEIHDGHVIIQPINELLDWIDDNYGGANPW